MSIDSTERLSVTVRGRLGVPWLTVLPFAVVMSYADGFWMTTMRGAVGAIERTREPFTTWLRESTVTLPFYVLAVLTAMTLALRLFGPVLRSSKAVLVTALLVATAGTVVGIAQIAVSTVYDYYLQSDQLTMMDSMHGLCVDSCLEQAQASSIAALARAVAYVSGFLLVTNLVLVGWLVAMRGGRIKVSTIKRQPTGADWADGNLQAAGRSGSAVVGPADVDAEPAVTGRANDIRLLIVAVLLASAHIHAAVIPEHLTHWPAAALFFVLLTAAEIAVAALLLGRLQRWVLIAAAAVSIVPLVLWLSSRVVGLPFGPSAFIPEAVGLPDVLAGVLEIVTLVGVVLLLRHGRGLERIAPVSAHVRGLVLVAVIAVAAIGIAGSAPTWFDNPSSGDSVTVTHDH